MTILRAVVKKGRLVLDEPTNLPEGTVIELAPIDERAPESAYEPVSLRDLELVEGELAARGDATATAATSAVTRPNPPSAIDEASTPSPRRAPLRDP